jgi:hypothetical protein
VPSSRLREGRLEAQVEEIHEPGATEGATRLPRAHNPGGRLARFFAGRASRTSKRPIILSRVTLASTASRFRSLAGLPPPQYGIYCHLVGGLFYALFGSSRQLAIGPTSAISMLVGVTVAGMAQGDPGRWASIAALTAVHRRDVRAGMAVSPEFTVNPISETILLGCWRARR